MLVWRLNIWRNPTMGEKYTSPLSFSSGANSSFASDCGLLVIAPKRPQVVSFNALTVRSGSALPSLHQNSQPISQGTYSTSSLSRSKTTRAASMTSLPTPSPGIQAILYLAIGCRSYRRRNRSQVTEWGKESAKHAKERERSEIVCSFLAKFRVFSGLFGSACLRAKARSDQIFGAARDN